MYTEQSVNVYRQISYVDRESKLSTPTDATKITEQNSASEQSKAGRDTVTISDEAKMAASQLKSIDTEYNNLKFSMIKTITTKDGTQVAIESAVDPKTNASIVRVNFTNPDGSTHSEIIKESALLRQDESGQWELTYNDPMTQEIIDYATLNIGKDDKYTYQKYQRSISGTDADDIIILLPSATDKGAVWNVDAGDGDNIIVDLSNEISNITTGSGNDTIIGLGDNAVYKINSGSGNDSIELSGKYALANIDAGDGNDRINAKIFSAGNISGGSGDDEITIEAVHGAVVGGTIAGGAGKDKINIIGNIIGTDIYGGSNDDADSDDDEINISGMFSKGTIDGGNGKNKITIGSSFSSTITGGSEEDSISIGAAHDTVVNSGDGDDNITIRHASESKIFGGNGSNNIHIIDLIGSEVYGSSKETKTISNDTTDKTEKKSSDKTERSEYDEQIAEAAIGSSERKEPEQNSNISVESDIIAKYYDGTSEEIKHNSNISIAI